MLLKVKLITGCINSGCMCRIKHWEWLNFDNLMRIVGLQLHWTPEVKRVEGAWQISWIIEEWNWSTTKWILNFNQAYIKKANFYHCSHIPALRISVCKFAGECYNKWIITKCILNDFVCCVRTKYSTCGDVIERFSPLFGYLI